VHQDHGNSVDTCVSAIDQVAVTRPAEFDPRKFMIPAMEAMTQLCRLRFEQFGSAGHGSRITPVSLPDMAAAYRSGSLDQRITAG
jgi:fructose-bisphosphate aldolase class II